MSAATVIAAILLPPLGIFLACGMGRDFWIATILTALVPLVIYFVSGRWFVRGIAAGAVKG